jgi:ABC-type branched-subunit amino acid transport system substrate-binding protein
MNTALRGENDTHRAVVAASAVASVLLLAACGGGSGSGDGPGPAKLDLVIGNTLPLSGGSSALGQSGRKASQIALGQIEQAAGQSGSDHSVRIVNQDQGADGASAVDAAKQLVDSDGATCLTGPWSSEALARTAEDVAIPKKVLEISPVATGLDVAELNDHDLVDSTALPVSTEGDAVVRAIEQSLGGIEGRTVNVAAGTDPDAASVGQDFVRAWQDEKGTIGAQVVLAPGSADASRLTSANPNAILLAATPAGFSQIAPSLSRENGWNPAIAWGTDQLVSPGLSRSVGAEAIDGMSALAPGMPSGEPATSAFAGAFKQSSPRGVRIAPFAAQQFDATVLCYLAAVAAGSTDGQKMADELIDITAPGGTEYSWQQLPEAVRALEDGKDIDYTGGSGPIDMGVNGNATDGVFGVYRYSSGRLEPVGEIPISQPNPALP